MSEQYVKLDISRDLNNENINGYPTEEYIIDIDMNNIFEIEDSSDNSEIEQMQTKSSKNEPNKSSYNVLDIHCSESSDEDANEFQNQDLSPEKIKDIILGSIGIDSFNTFKSSSTRIEKLRDRNVGENIFGNRSRKAKVRLNSDVEHTKINIVNDVEDRENNDTETRQGEFSNKYLNNPKNGSLSDRLNAKYKVYKNVKKTINHPDTNFQQSSPTTLTKYLGTEISDLGTNIDIKHDYSNDDIDVSNGNIMSAHLQQFECFEQNTLKLCFSDSYKMHNEWENERNITMEFHTEQNDLIELTNKTFHQKAANNKRPANEETSGYKSLHRTRTNESETYRRGLSSNTEINNITSNIKPKSDIQIRINFKKLDHDKNNKNNSHLKQGDVEVFTKFSDFNTKRNISINENANNLIECPKYDDHSESNDIFDYLKLDKRRPSEIKRDLENKMKNRKRRSLRVERLKQIQENAKELLRLKEANEVDECPKDLINESIPPITNKLCEEMPVLEPVVSENKNEQNSGCRIMSKLQKKKMVKSKPYDTQFPLKIPEEELKMEQNSTQISPISKRGLRSSTDSNKNKKLNTCTFSQNDDENDIKRKEMNPSNNNKVVIRKPRELENLKSDLQASHFRLLTNGKFLNNYRVTRNFRLLRSHFVMNNRYQRINRDKRRISANEMKKSRHRKIGKTNNKITDLIPSISKELTNKNGKISRSVEFFDNFSSKVYCDILQQSSKLQHMLDDMMSDDHDTKNENKLSIVEISGQKSIPTKVNDLSGEVKLTTFSKDQKLQSLDSGHESDIDENSCEKQINKISNHNILSIKIDKKMPRLKRMVYDYPPGKLNLYTQNTHNVLRYLDKSQNLNLSNGNLQISSTTICTKDDKMSLFDRISANPGEIILKRPSKAITNTPHNSNFVANCNCKNSDQKFYVKTCSEPKDGIESLIDIGDDKEVQLIHIKNNIVIIVKEKTVNFYEHSTGLKFFRSPKLWLFKGSLSRYMPVSEIRLEQVTNQLTTSADMVTAYIELLIKPRNLNSSQLFTAVCDMSAVIYRYNPAKNMPSKSVLHLDYPQCSMDCLVFTVLPSDRAVAVGYTSSMSNSPDFTIKKYLMPKDYTGNTDIITLPEVTFQCSNLQAVNADIILGYGSENVVLWHHGYETILQIISLQTLSQSIIDRDLASLFDKTSTSRCVWTKLDSSCGTVSALHMLIHNPAKHVLMLLTGNGTNWSEFKIMHIFDLPKSLQRLKSITVGQYRVVADFEEGGISYDFPLLPLQTENTNLSKECSAINIQKFETSAIHACGEMVVFCKNGTAIPLSIEQL